SVASMRLPWRGAAAMFSVMSRRRRIQLLLTIALTLVGAIAELVTIGAVLPLLALVADPAYFERYPVVGTTLASLGLASGTNLIGLAALFLIAAAAFSAAVRSAL